MDGKTIEEELESAISELKESFDAFETAAKKFLSVMDDIRKKKNSKPEDLSEDVRKIHEFLIQIKDKNGLLDEKRYGIKCFIGKEADSENK